MQSSQLMQRCENCNQMFPETKINSHFSYCRRNIKKCAQCNMMVDINFQEDHNQEFHTNKPCQFCKREFKADEVAKHEGACTSKPKYCEYCQLNINNSQFSKHIVSCGSRTNTCQKCEKHIMLKDFAVHQVQCKGKVEENLFANYNEHEAFKKKDSREIKDNREIIERELKARERQERDMKEMMEIEKEIKRQREKMINDNKNKQQAQHQNGVNNYKVPSSRDRKEDPRRVEPTYNVNTGPNIRGNVVIPPTYNKPRAQQNNKYQRNMGNIQPKPTQPTRNQYKKEEPTSYNPTKNREEYKSYNYKANIDPPKREQRPEEKLERQQRQYLKREKQLRQQKEREREQQNRNPITSEHDYINFDLGGEDLQMQRILMEDLEKKGKKIKAPSGFEDLGMDHMSQSFYRDIEQQRQIEESLKEKQRQAPKRR